MDMPKEERIRLQVETATAIFKRLNESEEMKYIDIDKKWELLCEAQPEFTRCYPVVCIAMIDGRFHPETFELWLERLEHDPGKGMDGYCERQADYSRMLFKKLTRGWTPEQAKIIWKTTYDMLKKEQKGMEKAEKDATEKQKEERAKYDDELRNEFYKYLLNNKK